MTLSELVLDILELTIEGEQFEEELFHQIEMLNSMIEVQNNDRLNIFFEHAIGIEKYVAKYKSNELDEFGNSIHRISKLILKNTCVNVLASTTLNLTNGIIVSIEICNTTGPLPKEELLTYELSRK